jgi:farnesyl-diphosphate farnesyltransferase
MSSARKSEIQKQKELQSHLLQGVSRTFAITIPQLPPELQSVVGNAYLLCRAVDTIEDEPSLNSSHKKQFCDRFVQVVNDQENPKHFSKDLISRLSIHTKEEEKELVSRLHDVITITKSFTDAQRESLIRCVKSMAEGMSSFQEKASRRGLQDLQEMRRYCYYVAGVVGEMLTDLFCLHSKRISERGHELRKLSVSFGQGLQMTNILKDVWEDYDREICWLPREEFLKRDYDLEELRQRGSDSSFQKTFLELIRLAQGNLQDALQYARLIPRHEIGIRKFLLQAVSMAVMTLDKIEKNPGFTRGDEVKITRSAVKRTLFLSNLMARSDFLISAFSRLAFPKQEAFLARQAIKGP